MMFAKRILAIFVSTACAATFLVGCSDDSWAAKTDDTTVPAGQYIYYILKETMDAEQKLDATPSTSDSDFFKLTIEDQSAESWIQSHARKDMKNAVGAEIEFENLGLSLTDEGAGVWGGTVLQYHAHSLSTGGLHQGRELLHGALIGVFLFFQHRRVQAHQHHFVSDFFCISHKTPYLI